MKNYGIFFSKKIQYWNLIYLFDFRQNRRFSQTPTIYIWPVVHSRDTKDVNKLDKRYKTLLEYLVFSFRLWGILCLKSKISRYNKKYLYFFFYCSSPHRQPPTNLNYNMRACVSFYSLSHDHQGRQLVTCFNITNYCLYIANCLYIVSKYSK